MININIDLSDIVKITMKAMIDKYNLTVDDTEFDKLFHEICNSDEFDNYFKSINIEEKKFEIGE